MVELTDAPIDTTAVLARVQSPLAGAVVLFLGTTRQFTAGRETSSLRYASYREMALQEMIALENAAHQRWPLVATLVIHRLGQVGIGEVSVAVAVSAAHRGAAFLAGQWLIDELKKTVPIWKEEQGPDGAREWIHPPATP